MLLPIGCYSFVITKWHEENPNDWVAIGGGTHTNDLSDPDHHILFGRDTNLLKLAFEMKRRDLKVTYAKAWGLGIGKDYPISEVDNAVDGQK